MRGGEHKYTAKTEEFKILFQRLISFIFQVYFENERSSKNLPHTNSKE